MRKLTWILFLSLFVCCDKPTDTIIDFSENKYSKSFKKYGEKFQGQIELSQIFDFKWDKLYIFYPSTPASIIEEQTGFKYDGEELSDDYQMFIFMDDKNIVKKYEFLNTSIAWFKDDKQNSDAYIIDKKNSKFNIKKFGENNYWLTRIQQK